jgi:hypothetical protein
MRIARDRDMRDIAAAVADELGDGWYPALDRSGPGIAYVAHGDGREIRLARSGRSRERIAIQGTARAGGQLRLVGQRVTVALDSSGQAIGRHIIRRLLPPYTEQFPGELERAKRQDADEAEGDRIAAGLQDLGGDLDLAARGGRKALWFRGLGFGTQVWVEPGGETELHLRVSGETALRIMRIVTEQERRPSSPTRPAPVPGIPSARGEPAQHPQGRVPGPERE